MTATVLEAPAEEAGRRVRGRSPKGGDGIWGTYDSSEIDRWVLCNPQRGNLVVVDLPAPFSFKAGVNGVFLVKDTRTLAEGSLALDVHALQADEPAVTRKLSGAFKESSFAMHLCSGIGPCEETTHYPFHVTRMELLPGEDHGLDNLTAASKKYLKEFFNPGPVTPAVEAPGKERGKVPNGRKDAPKRKETGGRKATMTKEKPKREGREAKSSAPAAGVDAEKAADLRRRLEEAKRRREKESGFVSGEEGSHTAVGSVRESSTSCVRAPSPERLTASKKLPKLNLGATHARGETRQVRESPGHLAIKGGTSNQWKPMSNDSCSCSLSRSETLWERPITESARQQRFEGRPKEGQEREEREERTEEGQEVQIKEGQKEEKEKEGEKEEEERTIRGKFKPRRRGLKQQLKLGGFERVRQQSL